MNRIVIAALALGLGSLAACQKSPQEAQAENIESNADNAAEAFEAAADNTGNDAEAEMLENTADTLRETGENIAENVAQNAAD